MIDQPQIPLSKSTGMECKNCSGIFFDQTTLLRRISRLHIGSPQDIIAPVLIFICRQCGMPNTDPDVFPQGMMDIEQRFTTDNKSNLLL